MAVRSADETVAAVEHEAAREPRVAEARSVDRLQATAAREHLIGARHAGEVLGLNGHAGVARDLREGEGIGLGRHLRAYELGSRFD